MSKSPISLQSRLTLLVLGAVLLFGIIAGFESYRNALHEADELFDAQLAQFAQSMLTVATDLDDDEATPLPPPKHKYQQEIVFEIWSSEHDHPRLLLRSNAELRLPLQQLSEEEFSSLEWQGKHWRFYRQHDAQRDLDVVVGQSDKARNELAREVALHNVTPFLFGLPVLALVSILAIRLGLRPLRQLTDSIQRLSPEQLTPIGIATTPKEIVPVLAALNSLLARTAKVIENERRFTADAAHELRTPIAALQAQIQAAQLSSNETERTQSLAKSLLGTERMSHLVGQLLTLSRLDDLALLQGDAVDMAAVTRSCCAELAPGAIAKNISLELNAEGHIPVQGSEDLLRILLRNLLDNAIRYTPSGGRISVGLRIASDRGAVLQLVDSGCGVDAEQLSLLGERFCRLDQTGTEGVGLGLSIVMRIASLHRAKIAFGKADGHSGLAVTIHFPPD